MVIASRSRRAAKREVQTVSKPDDRRSVGVSEEHSIQAASRSAGLTEEIPRRPASWIAWA